MKARTRVVLMVITSLFFAAQLGCTLLDRNLWPLCSYNVFNRVPSHRIDVVRVVLIQDNGDSQEVDPGAVIPLEFFRATQVMVNVYITGNSRIEPDSFSRYLLDRLNRAPWSAFDETLSAARPHGTGRFRGFEVIVRSLNVPADPVAGLKTSPYITVYRYPRLGTAQ